MKNATIDNVTTTKRPKNFQKKAQCDPYNLTKYRSYNKSLEMNVTIIIGAPNAMTYEQPDNP